ncbi:MAG: zinc ribbon domain-containing protein [Chloroflexota bacterium]|nr:zinc ribbon domain-containing protein [Chloroflexota bacterium]
MPIYEFRCTSCQKKSSFLVRSVHDSLDPICPDCGSNSMERCLSRFAIHKSTKTIHEESGDPAMYSNDPRYYEDPRNIGRWAEHRLKEMGIDMDSDEYSDTFAEVKEDIAAAREGELPKIIKDQL